MYPLLNLLSASDIWHKPMLWWFVIPVIAAMVWAIFLAIDSRVPTPRKVVKKIRHAVRGGKDGHKPAMH